MKYKTIMIITLLLITFTIAAVSASDGNTTYDTLTSERDVEDLKIEDETNKLKRNKDEEIPISRKDESDKLAMPSNISDPVVGDSPQVIGAGNTFDELQILINNAGSTFTLDKDYVSNGTAITINKPIIINGAGYKLDAKGLSAIFNIESDNCTIANLTLCNVLTSSDDHGINIEGSGHKIENCIIENITGDGHAIQLLGTAEINTITINNVSIESDGAILIKGSNCVIANSSFTDCHAFDGGSIYVKGNYTVIANCTFNNSSSEYDGGAIVIDSSNCLIANSSFTFCSGDNGGAIYVEGKDSHIINCTFSNSTSSAGGAIYYNSTGVLESSTFNNTSTTGRGGSIYVASDSMKISSCSFANSNSTEHGGSIYWGGSDGLLINCEFTGCEVDHGFGGAIYWREIDGSVIDCNFTGCLAITKEGGAIYWNGDNGVIKNSRFENNRANLGGAIHSSKTNISNCTFIRCSSDAGGAIFSTNGGLINDSDFQENTASGNGGAVYFDDNSGSILNSIFTQNRADNDGGAVYGAGNSVSDSHFIKNTALQNGGAIYDCTYTNCVFKDNSKPAIYPFTPEKAPINVTAQDIFVGENATIIVSLPEDINSKINISVDDINYTVDVNKGVATLKIAGLKAGNYTVIAWFDGDDDYLPNNNSTRFSVSKAECPVNIEKNTDEGYILITVPRDITKTFTFKIDNKEYTLDPGSNKIDLTHFNTGNYTYSISYPGDERYNSYTSDGSIYLSKTIPELIITANDTTYGQGGNITVSISDNITGVVNFTLLSEENVVIDSQLSPAVKGIATYMIPELNVGRYKLNAQSTGDSEHYKSSIYSASFNVAPKISITPDVIIGDDGIITMELGNVSGLISVSVDGELDGSKRIVEGKFIYALSTWALLVGNHTLTFEYTGTSFDKNVFNYWDNQTGSYKPIEYKFHIEPKHTDTKSDSDNDHVLEVILEDEHGNVLSNATGQVEFEILNQFTKEVQRVVVDVVNGIALLDISKFKDGDYLITWNYLGDGKHTPISKQLTLKITHKPSKISAGDLTILYTLPGTYHVTVYGSSGDGISGVPVTFLINNRVVKTVRTNSHGVASITVSQNPGSYRITAKTDSLSITKSLTVSHLLTLKTVKVKKSAKKLDLTASLKKVKGKYLKGKKITFKFNGKKYSAKTNKKGVAKVTVKSNVLKKLKAGKKITYQATYLKDTVKKSVKVKK